MYYSKLLYHRIQRAKKLRAVCNCRTKLQMLYRSHLAPTHASLNKEHLPFSNNRLPLNVIISATIQLEALHYFEKIL